MNASANENAQPSPDDPSASYEAGADDQNEYRDPEEGEEGADEYRDPEEGEEGADAAAVEAARYAAQQAPAAEVPQNVRAYVPQVATSAPSDEDKARLTAALETWDPGQVMGVVTELANKAANAAISNYMAAQTRTAADPIEAIAQRRLYEAAQRNPQVLNNPQALELARVSAAIEYGYETGSDIWATLDRVRPKGRAEQIAPGGQPAPPTQQPPPRDQSGQFAPRLAPTQATPGGGAGARPGAGRRAAPGGSTLSRLERALPFAKRRDLEDIADRR